MTKTLKPLQKHYAHLDALERYRLFAQAHERDDEDEINRLLNSCPYEEGTYRVRDWIFLQFYQNSQHLCAVFTECFTETLHNIAFLMLLLDYCVTLDVIQTRGFATGFVKARDRSHEEKFDTKSRANELLEVFKGNSEGIGKLDKWKKECDIIKERIGELKVIYGAMRKFCDEAGLEMGDILCWNSNIKKNIVLAKSYLEAPIAVDEAFLEALHRGFRSIWIGKPEEYPAPFTEEELERYGREVKRDTEGFDAIDIYISGNRD